MQAMGAELGSRRGRPSGLGGLPYRLLIAALVAMAVAQAEAMASVCAPIAVPQLGFSCQVITVQGGNAQQLSTTSSGASMWQNRCNGGVQLTIPAMQMPQLASGPGSGSCSGYAASETLVVSVVFQATQPGGESPQCGYTDANFTLRRATIWIYDRSNDGGDCSQRKNETLAHELGHSLGLGDLSPEQQLSCAGRVMSGNIFINGQLVPRSVVTDDCNQAHAVNSNVHPPGGGGGTRNPDPCVIY